MSRHENQAKALLDAWEVVMRFRWQFVVPAFLVCAGVLAASLLLPRKYKAEAIFERRTDMVMEEIASRGGANNYEAPRVSLVHEIAGEPAIDDLFKREIKQIQAAAERSGRRFDATTLRRDLSTKLLVFQDIGTRSLDRVRLSYTGEDPEIAREAVNGLVRNYIDRTRIEMESRLRQSEAFFKAEVDRSRADIERLENMRLDFEIKHVDLLPDNPNNIQSVLAETQEQFAELVENRDAARMKATALTKALEGTPDTTPSYVTRRNPDLDRREKDLNDLETRLKTYTTVMKMTERHPDLVDLRRQIVELNAVIAQTPREVVSEKRFDRNVKHQELELLVTQANAQADALNNHVSQMEAKIRDLSNGSVKLFPVRAEYSKMQREIDQSLRQLAFWEGNLNRVKMSLTAEDGNRGVQLNFIKPCPEIGRPVSPDLAHVILAATAMGLLAGAVSVLFAHRTNESFISGEELSRTVGVPLMGAVSEIISKQQRRMKRIRHYLIYPLNLAGMALVLLMMTGLLYVNLNKPEKLGQMARHPGQFISDHLTPANDAADTQD